MKLRVWNVATGKQQASFYLGCSSVAWTPDGNYLAIGQEGGKAVVWNVAKEESLVTLNAHSDDVTALAISANGKVLATGSYDKTVKLWDISRLLGK